MAEADNTNKTGEGTGSAKPAPGVPKKMEDILLPKKEAATPSSATRVNAAVLLEQEQAATLQKPQEQKPKEVPPPPKKEEQLVRPLETYRGAIEQAVQQQNVSVVSIAAAEAKRRAETPISAQNTEGGSTKQAAASGDLGFTIAALSGGALLIAGAAAVLAFIFWRPQADAPVINTPPSPFIEVDDVQIIAIPAVQWQRNIVLGAAEEVRESIELSLGLMSRLYLAQATTTGALPPPASAQDFLAAVAPNIPGEFLRSLSGVYLLGVHSFDGNQAFLILEIEDYEAAYAGILDWELAMPNELSPLFSRTPRPRIPEENITPPEATPVLPFEETSTTSTSSPQTSTSTAQPEPLPDFFRTRFVDKVVENHDARVIQDENGDILLLWTFLDRKVLVITTNEYTLREIISRRARPPVISL